MKKIIYGFVAILATLLLITSNASAATYESTNWDALVKAMKSEKFITQLKEELPENTSVAITSDNHNLNFSVKNQDEEIDYQVKYSQYNGIVRFTSANVNKEKKLAKVENAINVGLLLSVAEVYGYTEEQLLAFIFFVASIEEGTTNVNDDGIELTYYTYEEVMEFIPGEGVTVIDPDPGITTTAMAMKTLAINIDCGISAFTNYVPEDTTEPEVDPEPETKPEVDPEPETKPEQKPEVDPEPETKPEQKPEVDPEPETKPEVKPEEDKETTVENPPTSLYVSFGIIGVAVAGLIGFMVSRKKSYFSKI